MKLSLKYFVSILIALLAFSNKTVLADGAPRWTISRFMEPPMAWDGSQVVEGTATAAPWSWHARVSLCSLYGIGLAERSSQTRGNIGFGLGLPWRIEGALAMPVGYTIGLRENSAADGGSRLNGMGDDGPAVGDLSGALLWSAFDSVDGGFGLLFGLKGTVPTGDHERLMGEGGFTAEPFGVIAFQLLGSRLSLNLGYRIRPEHIAPEREGRFEQNDDLFWRAGIRIPRKFDIAWSIEAEGAIGMATKEGPWPGVDSRPVWIGAGVDFPASRLNRFGIVIGAGVAGEAAPKFSFGLSYSWLPVLPDEDADGVGGSADRCPLLKEDLDNFEDGDGCPDSDNDRDGFPDDEDRCPTTPAGGFSEDGC
jgi:hypothetical protein